MGPTLEKIVEVRPHRITRETTDREGYHLHAVFDVLGPFEDGIVGAEVVVER